MTARPEPTIHLVYPHRPLISAPHVIGWQLGQRLEHRYHVNYYDWDERQTIRPQAGDMLIGHPHPARGTVFRRSAALRGWRRVLMMAPYNHGELGQVAFEDPIIRHCDQFLAITGPSWFNSISQSPCSHWAPKMVHLDLAVDRQAYPALKSDFSDPGQRRVVYIGQTAKWKGTDYLSQIARQMPETEFGWIGEGDDIEGVRRFGRQDFSTSQARALIQSFDFMLTVGRADSNPTTILESMSWGLIPVCTAESGYVDIPSIPNVPLDDTTGAVRVLQRLIETPSIELKAIQDSNWRLLDEHYNWERFAGQVFEALESDACPPLGPESFIRRAHFLGSELASRYGPIRRPYDALNRKVRRRGRAFLERGAGRLHARSRPIE